MQGEKAALKLNLMGIIGGILAFISLALPWWTISVSTAFETYGNFAVDTSVYLYTAGTLSSDISLWYGWVALALITAGGLIGIAGSLKPDKAKMLSVSGALALVSIIIFAVGLQIDLLRDTPGTGAANVYLFYMGSDEYASYFAYLSFGFWIALVAAIVMFAASKRKTAQIAGFPPPPPTAH